jgi:hypothetical protein
MAEKRKQSRISEDHLPIEGHRGRRELHKLYAMNLREAYLMVRPGLTSDDHGVFLKAESSLMKWSMAQELRKLYDDHKEGDNLSVIKGLSICIQYDLPIPQWCAKGFLTGVQEVNMCRAKSWDDVFGRPYQKGAHLSALMKRKMYRAKVWFRIQDLKKQNPAIALDEHLFESVGREFGIGGKTLTQDYYYEFEEFMRKAEKGEK